MTLDNSMIIAGFTACGTAITAMWCSLKAENNRLNKRSDKCEEDRKTLFEKLYKITGDSELLKHCPHNACPLRQSSPDHLHNPVPLHT
jgi:hypothetical protein